MRIRQHPGFAEEVNEYSTGRVGQQVYLHLKMGHFGVTIYMSPDEASKVESSLAFQRMDLTGADVDAG